MEDILVSISCITYNHEKYIADAIESFLMQQTNFKYEILIHDDASTDRTAEIIREYEKQYPDLIKPIYQIENQYSKGVSVSQLNHKRANGKYIALCEGDDYWTDPLKLQKQFNYLEEHPDCSLVFHAADIVNENKSRTGNIAKIAEESKPVKMNEISLKAEPNFIPTASRMYRKVLLDNPPNWYLNASVGDFPSALIIGNSGYFYYMHEMMSAYRIGVKGSWSDRKFNNKYAVQNAIAINKECIQILADFNVYSNYQFKKEIDNAKKERRARIVLFVISSYFPKWFVNLVKKNVDVKQIIYQTKRLLRT